MSALDRLDTAVHILHARRLLAQSAPAEVDLRSAVAAAYYAVYHDVTFRSMAQVVGQPATDVGSPSISRAVVHLVRWLTHRSLIEAGGLVRRLDYATVDPSWPARRIAAWELLHEAQQHPLPTHLLEMTEQIESLQELRHRAHYDRVHEITLEEATIALERAEQTLDLMRRYGHTPAYRAFFVLVAMSARGGAPR